MGPVDDLDSMGTDLPFDQLVQALRNGDSAAWERVFDRLLPRVKSAIRRQFGAEVARSENAGGDAMASACRTLYSRIVAGQFQLASWDDLAGLLIRISTRKCLDRLEEGRRFVNWTDLPKPPDDSDGTGLQPAAPGGSTDAEVIRTEAHRELKRALDLVRRQLKRSDKKGDGKAAMIFQFLLDGGCTNAAIAAMVGRSERTVDRVWAEAKDLLKGMLDGSIGEDLID